MSCNTNLKIILPIYFFIFLILGYFNDFNIIYFYNTIKKVHEKNLNNKQTKGLK